jgi:NADH dehydrogenase
VFAIPGSGQYELQPIFVEDIADLMVMEARSESNRILDAAGPEKYSFEGLVRQIAGAVGSSPRFFHASPRAALQILRFVGSAVGDVILTREEIGGLMTNLLVSKCPPTGWTRFSEWLTRNSDILGRAYSSELRRHYL